MIKKLVSVFIFLIKNYEIGETVLIEILRSGNKMYMPVTLMHKDSLLMGF